MKRSIHTTIVTVALALFACGEATAQTEVSTHSGAIEGSIEGAAISWKGIPFAAPPVGELRWRAPQPAGHWDGVRQTTEYGHDCMQEPFPNDEAPIDTIPAEDCLYVNVWKPHGNAKKLPVIFWIHGGGSVNGGTSPRTYSGAELAKQGVIVVSANYRLGRFATFAHPQLTAEESEKGLLGNYGLLDQRAALMWVRDNIAAFGGDPDNCTIVGQSSGGGSVHVLMTSAKARGLFAKAVAMSAGNLKAMEPNKLDDVERIGVAFARTKAIVENDPDALRKLRDLSAEDVTDGLNISQAMEGRTPRTFAWPFADGENWFDPDRQYSDGAFARVPLMIGATSDDPGGKLNEFVAGARDASARIAAQGVPVYQYRFSYVAGSIDNGSGAKHATEIPFFFNTQSIKYGNATTERDNEMGRTISAYLVNFARSGSPNGKGLPNWPRYEKTSDVIMDFAATGTAIPQKDPLGEILDSIAR